jgi:HAD superfamily hydrolase (TIGR01490 family)
MSHVVDSAKLPIVAVFDFDGTLTRRDSLLPFLRIAMGSWKFWWGLLVMSPILVAYALRLIPNWWAKQALLTYFLAGWREQQLQEIAQRFAVEEIPKLVHPEALARLRWHQEKGHQTILVSASLEVYLLPWAKIMGFDQVIGTQLEVQNDILTGRILGKNCHGKEKIIRLKALMQDLSQYCLYGYGDSRGDRELLNAVNYPYYRTFQDAVVNSRHQNLEEISASN